MSKTKISIITPSYNQGQYIEQTIDSILSQKRSFDEYIIIDGKSTDNTLEIIKKYSSYLTYWISEEDKGQSDAINKGLRIASGEVVNWINSDDFLEPDAINFISESFRDPDLNVLAGKSRKFDKGSSFISRGTEVYNELTKTIGWARIDQPETWFRRNAFIEVGVLSSQMHYLMDREWWVRYLLTFGQEGIRQVEKVLVNFRHHQDSKTISKTQLFEVDHDTIFYGLAENQKLGIISDFIRTNFQINPDYKFPNGRYQFQNHGIFDYYFLRKAERLYYEGNVKLARSTLRIINKTNLQPNDKLLYSKLSLRSSKLLFPILSKLRRWRMS